jgi:hypothetical protein
MPPQLVNGDSFTLLYVDDVRTSQETARAYRTRPVFAISFFMILVAVMKIENRSLSYFWNWKLQMLSQEGTQSTHSCFVLSIHEIDGFQFTATGHT